MERRCGCFALGGRSNLDLLCSSLLHHPEKQLLFSLPTLSSPGRVNIKIARTWNLISVSNTITVRGSQRKLPGMLQVFWLILLPASNEQELRSESNSCIQPGLKLGIWRMNQTLTQKSPKWGSGPLARGAKGGRAPWRTLAMGMAPWGGQGHHVLVRIWSGGYQCPRIPALKTKLPREGHLSDLGLY